MINLVINFTVLEFWFSLFHLFCYTYICFSTFNMYCKYNNISLDSLTVLFIALLFTSFYVVEFMSILNFLCMKNLSYFLAELLFWYLFSIFVKLTFKIKIKN